MESESDQFESADENFESDSDEIIEKTVDKIKLPVNEIKSLTIKDNTLHEQHDQTQNENTTTCNDDLNINKTPSESLLPVNNPKRNDDTTQTDETNANVPTTKTKQQQKPRVIVRKERRIKEPKMKLGVKLGTKIVENPDRKWVEFGETEDSSSKIGAGEDMKDPWNEQNIWGEPQSIIEDKNAWGDFEDFDTKNTYSKKLDEKNFWDKEADYMELPQEKLEETPKPIETEDQTSWGGWGNWGVSSLLSTATLVSNSVSQGINTVLEAGIGAPDPAELARIHKEQTDVVPGEETGGPSSGFGLGNFVSGVAHITKLVETTGTKVLSGGLDTLEVIGKKTIEVLQEGDPGLKKKRALFFKDAPTLSQIIREKKDQAENINEDLLSHQKQKKPNFEISFDDLHGLVHLEALEMLSKQCEIKLDLITQSLTGKELVDFEETLAQVKDFCELPEEYTIDVKSFETDSIRERLELAVGELKIDISYQYFLDTYQKMLDFSDLKQDDDLIFQIATEHLAQLTAISVEQFHKTGELLLIKEHRSTVDESDSLVQITITLIEAIGFLSMKLMELLENEISEERKEIICNISVMSEVTSRSYIEDAFKLMIPILQVGVNISG